MPRFPKAPCVAGVCRFLLTVLTSVSLRVVTSHSKWLSPQHPGRHGGGVAGARALRGLPWGGRASWRHGGHAGLGLWPGEGCGSCSFLSGHAVSLGCSPRGVFGCHSSGCQTGRAAKKLQRNETPGSSQPFLPPSLPLPSPSAAHTSLLPHICMPARGSTVLAPASPPSLRTQRDPLLALVQSTTT